MSKKSNKGLMPQILPAEGETVPKLRFPEFRDKGEWKEKKLCNLAKRITKKNRGNEVTRVLTNSAADGIVDQRDYFDKDIANKSNLDGYFIVDMYDYVYNPRVSNSAPVGPISKNKIARGVVSPLYTVFRFKNSKNVFYEHYFKSTCWHQYLRMVSNSGARHDRMSITIDAFEEMPLPDPLPDEQKKIADCLSSIDDLITAQAQKIESLKDHKKGLMQQLFPAEGETVPKLRFPEFLDKGGWQEVKLSQLGKLISGLTYTPDDIRDNGLLVLRSSNVQDGKIDLEDNVFVIPDIKGANLSRPNDILICVRNGSVALIGKNALIPEGMPLCTHGAFMTIFRAKTADFVFQLFQTHAYYRQVAGDLGATINSINGGKFIKYCFRIPTLPEQQKIADCLSSIDDLITAQAQKVESLKAHKKGLMQQLFPTSAEVEQ